MFEQEMELEKHQSSALPLLLIVGIIVALVGIAGYFLIQSRKSLSPTEASQVVTNILNAQDPPAVSFHVGLIRDGYEENAKDPRYRLLERAGVITIGKSKAGKTPVALTAKGEDLIKQVPGVKQKKDDEGIQGYTIPLAERKLIAVSEVKMKGPERASITYTWKWMPNTLGNEFDASAGKLAGFTTWERVTLIDKQGARFYQETPPPITVNVVAAKNGWVVAAEERLTE
jgi:hypothetical protein